MSIEAMKQALEALKNSYPYSNMDKDLKVLPQIKHSEAITTLQQAIEQTKKQEPVDWDLSNSATVERARKVVKLITERNQNAWSETDRETVHAINALINFAVVQFHRANTAPPKREWVGLTDEEIFDSADNFGSFQYGDAQGHKRIEYAKAIEAKLKEKNCG